MKRQGEKGTLVSQGGETHERYPGTVHPSPCPLEGVIFNAYPDSLGPTLASAAHFLGKKTQLRRAFSHFYILPTLFNSDLDRGFSIIDYNLNGALACREDLRNLEQGGLALKLDLVLNHLSTNSPQFLEMLESASPLRQGDFFIDWNQFWAGHGSPGPEGWLVPHAELLAKLFTRKPGLPVMKITCRDGRDRFFWNTFYRQVNYGELSAGEVVTLAGLPPAAAARLAAATGEAARRGEDPADLLTALPLAGRSKLRRLLATRHRYLGQLDLDARSPAVWAFYGQTLAKLKAYGARMVRLDAFAYLHKAVGRSNFFNYPETYFYLEQLKAKAAQLGLLLLPEIHSAYGTGLHREIAARGYPLYDFFFPGLLIDALERRDCRVLQAWIREIIANRLQMVNMLGCHDGIPILDLKGGAENSHPVPGLLNDASLERLVDLLVSRGGRVKNLHGPGGGKTEYYQVNATFYSALGEDDGTLLFARVLQLFMPGTPQVWYLDLFAGKNDYEAVDRGGPGGHKEINRTNLTPHQVAAALLKPIVQEQLKLIRLRNTHPAFRGSCKLRSAGSNGLELSWRYRGNTATLRADFREKCFQVSSRRAGGRGHFFYRFP